MVTQYFYNFESQLHTARCNQICEYRDIEMVNIHTLHTHILKEIKQDFALLFS